MLILVQLLVVLWTLMALADPVLIFLAARATRGGDLATADRRRRQVLQVTAASFGTLVVLWPVFLLWSGPA